MQLTPNMAHYDVPNLLHSWMDGTPLSITITDLIRPIIGFAIRKHQWLTLLMMFELNRRPRAEIPIVFYYRQSPFSFEFILFFVYTADLHTQLYPPSSIVLTLPSFEQINFKHESKKLTTEVVTSSNILARATERNLSDHELRHLKLHKETEMRLRGKCPRKFFLSCK